MRELFKTGGNVRAGYGRLILPDPPARFTEEKMDTVLRKITGGATDADIIKETAGILKRGGIAVFPTETVYGIGADAFNEDACKRIYDIKKRPNEKALIVLISDAKDLDKVTEEIPASARPLIEKYWPGPLSIIFKKNKNIPDIVSGGTDTVAVRFTSNPILQKIITEAGTPIVAPSANISGRPAAVTAAEALKDFDGLADIIIEDDGALGGGQSTIVDVSSGDVKLIRQGAVQNP